ncbi:PAS domain S-box protein [Halorussus salinus]|uniref:PAS domain S-box protein n=1 Tax=Halorussus salinus TaxID=1364935 RepID=UPI00138F50FD|nr:PAS domain S-box protein [Halorussus salinus]
MNEPAEASGSAFWGDADDEEALRRYRTLLDDIGEGVYRLDAEGRFVGVNDALLTTTGYARDELLGEHLGALLDASDLAAVERETERRLAGEAGESVAVALRAADGDAIPAEVSVSVCVADGEFRGATGVVREADRDAHRRRAAAVLDASPVGVVVRDADGAVVRANDRAGDLLGASAGECRTGTSDERPLAESGPDSAAPPRFYDEEGRRVPPDERPSARVAATGESVAGSVLRVEPPDGERRWLSVEAAPVSPDGDTERVVATYEDVTDLKERERELENELSEIFGRVTDAFYALDDEWQFTHANDRAEELVDYRGEGLVGRKLWDVFEWAADSKLADEYREAMATQEPTAFELYYPEPLEAWYEIRAYPSESGLSVYFRDVTERKRRERELEESERRYRSLAEYFPNGIVTLFDPDCEYTLAAGQAFDYIPVEPGDLEGRHFRDVWDAETADGLEPAFSAALDGEKRSVEVSYAGREWVVHAVPITDEGGDVFAGMTMAQDVTEQKERERYLREAKSQLEAATEAGAVGTWEWRIQEDEMVTGTSFAETFGVDPEAARDGVSLDRYIEAIHDEDRERVEREIAAAVESGEDYEAEYRVWNDDDELRWVVARGHVECDDEGEPVTFPGALTDITERKRAERELEDHRKQLETLFEVLPVGVVVADEDGGGVEMNDAATEIVGENPFTPDSVAEYDGYPGRWADTGEPVAPDEWTLARVLRGEEVTDPDVYELDAGDGERRTVMVHGMPIRDASGEVTRGVATVTDVTEREEREQRLQRQNERLESFASMLAHELRNPVTIGQIYSSQLPEGRASEAVGYVTEAFDRIEEMIDVMLVLTRGREAVGECNDVALAAVAREAWDGIDAPETSLDVEVTETVRADETYLRHLLRNLFENAIRHGDATTVLLGETETGFYVADDGSGIPAEERERVFEAGFTTAAGEGGTGLGLAFVEELAAVYGWRCRVIDSESGGARFEFENVDGGRA